MNTLNHSDIRVYLDNFLDIRQKIQTRHFKTRNIDTDRQKI